MNIIKDKDLIWDTDKYDAILVGTSIYNLLTQGFQSKLAMKYPYIVEANNSTPYADKRKYGKRLTIQGTPIISLMYICGYPHSKRDYLNYEALENCLATANAEFKGKNVATTILGTSLFDGNGDRERCMKIIEDNTDKLNLTVYDFPQYNRRKEIAMVCGKWNEYAKRGEWRKWKELKAHKDEIIAKLYLKH
jgi:hypothetical protein